MKNLIYNNAVRQLANTLIDGGTKLTKEHLKKAGWVKERCSNIKGKRFWVEPCIKDRDKVWIDLEKDSYRVWHGKEMTFIAAESSLEWLELYLLLRSKYVKFKDPIDILNGEGI